METIGSDPSVLTVSHRGVFTHNTPWEVSLPARTGADCPQGIQRHLDKDSLDRCLPEVPPAKLTTAPGGSGDRGKGQQDPLRTPGQALPSQLRSLHEQVPSCPHPRPHKPPSHPRVPSFGFLMTWRIFHPIQVIQNTQFCVNTLKLNCHMTLSTDWLHLNILKNPRAS